MASLISEICDFLLESGFECVERLHSGRHLLEVKGGAGGIDECRCVVPSAITALSPEDASREAGELLALLDALASEGTAAIVITEDRWRSQGNLMKARMLAHLEVFSPIYARNCVVRKIDKVTAAEFLTANHSYGDAACRHRYGLFLKRYTGSSSASVGPGALVAVATFSNARKWQKGDKVIRSYEWTRYASLPDVRISGGMGKMLKAFIEDVRPDDVMSYADLEWSGGRVYERLGFKLEGRKEAVLFAVDGQWRRRPVGRDEDCDLFFENFGSNKYRLKLTEYE